LPLGIAAIVILDYQSKPLLNFILSTGVFNTILGSIALLILGLSLCTNISTTISAKINLRRIVIFFGLHLSFAIAITTVSALFLWDNAEPIVIAEFLFNAFLIIFLSIIIYSFRDSWGKLDPEIPMIEKTIEFGRPSTTTLESDDGSRGLIVLV
jgi:hypothetical protein